MQAADLHEALASSMIETRYQPIVRMADRRPTGLEALARLNHPRHGTLLPEHFIPQMELAGLAAQLTDLVASRAFADMEGPVGALGLLLGLNLPLDVMLVPDALDRLEVRRQEAGLPANRVLIELTESRPVQDLESLGRMVERLRSSGYRVAIDDVAPTVPKVQQLLTLPFTTVKLDKHLVQESVHPETAAFIRMVVQLARHHGQTIVAEGVESVTAWQRIEELGAAYAQGFLVARPLAATAVPVWFEGWSNRSALTGH